MKISRESGRLRIVVVGAVIASALGVAAAHAALGTGDTFYGDGALASEASGNDNSAFGENALGANTTGHDNSAVGSGALFSNVSGGQNTAVGVSALYANTTGIFNSAFGDSALVAVTTGGGNTAIGGESLSGTTTGGVNTALGRGALADNTSGSNNTAVGYLAGAGAHGTTTGDGNTFLGAGAAPGTDTVLSGATAVGANAVVSQSDSLVLGAAGVNVGIATESPQSRLQMGTGATASWGDYLQLPVVAGEAKTPPPADCNPTTKVGRLVLQYAKKKTTLWVCTPAGVWAKM